MIRYEWHNPGPDDRAGIADADELRELVEDDDNITDSTIGVYFNDGGGGGMVYGQPENLLAYYTELTRRLAERVMGAPPKGTVRVVVPVVVDVDRDDYKMAYGDPLGPLDLAAYTESRVRGFATEGFGRLDWGTVLDPDQEESQ